MQRRIARGTVGLVATLCSRPRPTAARQFRLGCTLTVPASFGLDAGFGMSLGAVADTLFVGGFGDTQRGIVGLFDVRTGTLRHLLTNPSRAFEDGFGVALAATGEHIAVGAVADVAVQVFDPTGTHRVTLYPSAPADGWGFGRSVALGAGQNAVVAVGGSGTVYLFDARHGRLLQRLDSPLGGRDRFGAAVAFTGDILLVGAPAGTSAGRVYAYSTRSGALLWTRTGPAPQPDDGFGHALAGDGDVVAVGAPRRDGAARGAAYLVSAHTGALRRVYPAPPHAHGFGRAVALRGNRVLVGAPGDDGSGEVTGAAYLFAAGTGTRLATFRLSREYFARTGESVAFAGPRPMIGAPGVNVVGVFRRPEGPVGSAV